MSPGVSAALLVIAAYAIGSIPFSWLVARLFGVRDVRAVGSGNVGATNVMRSAGKLPGAIAFVLDFLKGVLASYLADRATDDTLVVAACAMAAVLGHMFPPWLSFRGGKGVATGAGAFVPLMPKAAAIALVTFPVVLGLTRYVSLASIAGAVVLAALGFAFGAPLPIAATAAVTAALVVWKHRENLRRLAAGTENRLGRPRA